MNKKHTSLLTPLIIAYSLQSMEIDSHSDIHTMEIDPPVPTLYLIHPKKYEQFKLTRPYGTFRSNFDFLPQDLFQTHIRQPLAKITSGKLRHAILNHNYEEKTDRDNDQPLKRIRLGLQKDIVFRHHDGNYTLAPDIGCNYAMWDRTLHNRKVILMTEKVPNTLNCAGAYAQLLCTKKQEAPEIKVCFPVEQYANNNKTELALAIANKTVKNYSFESKITHQVMSNDGEWLALGIQRESYGFVTQLNLTSFTFYDTFPLERITALSAAHKSPLFAACLEDNTILLLTRQAATPPYVHLHQNPTMPNDYTIIDAQFSPDDQRLITYGENILELHYLPQKESPSYIDLTITMRSQIRKALFTPDGKLIIIAMANGKLGFYNGLTGQPVTHHEAPWRCLDIAYIDNQPPLILYSSKNRLLFSLDPAQHTDATIPTFVVRKASGKFNFLTAYNFDLDNPKAMGLTEDERSVVFIHNDGYASILHLYDDRDMMDIDFIEQEAHIYQLCELLQLCKQYKTYQQQNPTKNFNVRTLVHTIRTYIKNCEKK